MHNKTFFSFLLLGFLSLGGCTGTKTTTANTDVRQENHPVEDIPSPEQKSLTASTEAIPSSNQQQKVNWLTLEEAYALNQKEPRKIFVDVYTDWCGWCKKMDKETFADPEVAAYVNENYYAVKLDAESTREFEFAGEKMTERVVARQMGVSSYPTIVFIHEDFKSIQPVPGYRSAKDFKEILVKFKAIDINQKQ